MEKIYNLINEQHFSWYIVLTIFIVIFIIKQVIHSFEYLHNYWIMREQHKINDLLEKQGAVSNSELRGLVQETIDEYTFRKCTGISVNQFIRKEIINLHLEYKIDFFHFKKAIRFIEINNDKLQINISILDKISKYFNITFSTILFLCSVYILYLLLKFINEFSVGQIFVFLLIIIGLSLFGIYVLTQNFPLRSAYLIKQKINQK